MSMRTLRRHNMGVKVYLQLFLNSVPHGCEWSASRVGRSTVRERPSPALVEQVAEWGPRTVLDVLEKGQNSCTHRELNHESSVSR
jgi:hypothetical protein